MTENFFTEKQILTPSDILVWISYAAQALIDNDQFEKALSLSTLMEYVANTICKSKIMTIKARILKSVSLIEMGSINEAY